MSKVLRKSLPIISLVVITLGAAILLNAGIQQYLNTPTPQIVVTTGSMIPTYNGYLDSDHGPYVDIFGAKIPEHIFRGDLLLIKYVPGSELKVGDVIVFEAGQEMPIVHRIIFMREQLDNPGSFEFLTKGDNNPITDYRSFNWIPDENVLGKVVLRVPNVGWLSIQLQTTAGRMIIITLAGLLLVISLFDDEEEENKKNEDKTSKTNKKQVKTKFKSKKAKLWHYFAKTKTGWSMIFAISLIAIFIGFNIVLASSNPCDVNIIAMNTDEYPNIQEFRPASNIENITYNPDINDYLINVRYTITSGGIFNSINRVIVSTNTSSANYVWTIVYQYSGTKIIKGVIPIQIDPSVAEIVISIKIIAQTTGLISSGNITRNFTMIFVQFEV